MIIIMIKYKYSVHAINSSSSHKSAFCYYKQLLSIVYSPTQSFNSYSYGKHTSMHFLWQTKHKVFTHHSCNYVVMLSGYYVAIASGLTLYFIGSLNLLKIQSHSYNYPIA